MRIPDRRSKFWPVVLTLPVQYLVVFLWQTYRNNTEGISYFNYLGRESPAIGEEYGCTNFIHGGYLYACEIDEMLSNVFAQVLGINILSFGAAFFLTAILIGSVIHMTDKAITRRENAKAG